MAKKPVKKPAAKKLPAPKPKPKKRKDKRGTPKGRATMKSNGGAIGNPPHVPTPEGRKLANDLASYGLPQWAIAEMLSISESTLQLHYSKEIRLGTPRMIARAANMVAQGVLDGDKDYVKFFLARRGGPSWSSKQELSTPPGQPLEFRNLSDEEVMAKIAEHEARRRAGE